MEKRQGQGKNKVEEAEIVMTDNGLRIITFMNLESEQLGTSELKQLMGEGEQEQVEHRGISCDSCGVCPIVGMRYKSLTTDDFDLCGVCRRKDDYCFVAMIEIPYSVHDSEDDQRLWRSQYRFVLDHFKDSIQKP